MYYTPKDQLIHRIKTLQGVLLKEEADGALISQNADLFYFAGTIQQSYLFIPAGGEPVLLVNRSMERARQESPLEQIIEFNNFKEIPGILTSLGYQNLKKIGFEADVLPTGQFWRLQKLFANTVFIDISSQIRAIRMIKSSFELKLIMEAAQMSKTIFATVKNCIQEGQRENDLAGIIEKTSRSLGHQGYIRTRGFNQEFVYVLLLSGSNGGISSSNNSPLGGRGVSSAFASGVSSKAICRNEPIIFDYQACVNGYMVDATRTYCIGQLADHLIRGYNAALEIQEMFRRDAKPGVRCDFLYQKACKIAEENKLAGSFMGLEKPLQFVGHGVGIEVDEWPVIAPGSSIPLQENMIIALEPKFIFSDGAVGIENTFVVTEKGLSNLTNFEESIQYI